MQLVLVLGYLVKDLGETAGDFRSVYMVSRSVFFFFLKVPLVQRYQSSSKNACKHLTSFG